MAHCMTHGQYQEGTLVGCPGCRMINAAPQVYPQTWSSTTSPDIFMTLLRERDRYRDALRAIVDNEDGCDANEIYDAIQSIEIGACECGD